MNSISKLCLKISNSKWFQNLIITIIILAGIVVGVQTYEVSSEEVKAYSNILHDIDAIILFFFTIEIVIKIISEGKRPLNYFKDSWNIFDFLIVTVCYVVFVIPRIDTSFIAVLRLTRILRVFKLVTALPKLQLLVKAMLNSIPSMFYVSLLLGLLFYIYAVMGVFFFGHNDPLHFNNLQNSMLSLFCIVTLEGWTDIMYANIYGCDHQIWGYDSVSECVNPLPQPILGSFYFISFVLLGTMIVLNLFIGVIMNSMNEVHEDLEERVALQKALENNTVNSPELLFEKIDNQIEEIRKELRDLKRRL
jgi:voltage-gated sodium channel